MKHRSTQSTVTKCQVLGFILLAPGTASLVSPNAPCWQHSTCSVQCGAAPACMQRPTFGWSSTWAPAPVNNSGTGRTGIFGIMIYSRKRINNTPGIHTWVPYLATHSVPKHIASSVEGRWVVLASFSLLLLLHRTDRWLYWAPTLFETAVVPALRVLSQSLQTPACP